MWLGAIGAAVIGAFGTTVAVTGLAAMVVGGAIVGAAVGALYQAFTGGNILKGVLYGAIGGATLGAGASLLGVGSAAGATGAGGVSAGTGGAATGGAATGAGSGILGSTGGAAGAGEAASSAALWKTGIETAGVAMSLGSAFLKGGLQPDSAEQQQKNLEMQQKIARERNEALLKQAELSASTTKATADLAQKTAAERLAFDKSRFSQDFAERKYQYRNINQRADQARQRNEAGILSLSKNIKTPTVRLAQVNRARAALPFPTWKQPSTQGTT